MVSEYIGTPVTLIHNESDMQLVALGRIEGRDIVNKSGRNPVVSEQRRGRCRLRFTAGKNTSLGVL